MKILVIEDDPSLLRTITRTLQEQGYAVDSAAEGDDGLFKAEGNDYDLILLDVLLPKLDGWSVLKRLRATKKTPVLMLTARDAMPDRVRGLDGGADDYLTKPFEFAELLARIRAVIRRHASHAQSEIKISDVVIDIPKRTVTSGGKPVSLTPREYSLLEFLALRRGQLVTRTMLYEHTFDETEEPMSNLIDVHVSNLRRKLGRDLIVTRRGHGFYVE
jgi:two-component system, OmpR family, response regulator